jgi:hypothetical protein
MFKKTLIALGLLAVGTGCIIVPPRPPMVLAPVPGAVVVAPVPVIAPVPVFGFWGPGYYRGGYYGRGRW